MAETKKTTKKAATASASKPEPTDEAAAWPEVEKKKPVERSGLHFVSHDDLNPAFAAPKE